MKKTELYKRKALSYVNRVMSGERIAGELEKLAVQRYLDDVANATEKGFYFDEKAAKMVFAFFTLLKHFQGEWAGKEFELEDWQCFIIWNIFGWKTVNGRRRFREAGIEVARKNGKTTFAAGIALYMLIMDNEPAAQVFSAAVDREQASICWTAAKAMIEQSPALQKVIGTSKTSIFDVKTASFYKPLSKETKNKDGLHPHCAICDELHAWPTDDIFGLISTGMGARRNPLIFCITTAGNNMTLPYYSRRTHYVNILKGIKTEESTFCIIYSPDRGDDWRDPITWQKASPNYGISIYPEKYKIDLEKAINRGGTTEIEFKTKNLNMWVDAPDVWIPDDKVLSCNLGTTDEELIGLECYAGLDLASEVDINALALYFPEKRAVKYHFWIPEGKVLQKEDRVDYRLWKEQGFIKITPGDVIDIEYILTDIVRILEQYEIKNIAFDPAKAYNGVIQGLQKYSSYGEVLDAYRQNIMNMSEPTKRLESMIMSGQIDLMNNPVIRWMLRNVVVYRDPNDNIKLDKKRSQEKIDGVVATVNAIGGYMSQPEKVEFIELRVLPSL